MPHAPHRRVARALAMLRGKQVETPGRKHDSLPSQPWVVSWGAAHRAASRRMAAAARSQRCVGGTGGDPRKGNG